MEKTEAKKKTGGSKVLGGILFLIGLLGAVMIFLTGHIGLGGFFFVICFVAMIGGAVCVTTKTVVYDEGDTFET